MKEKTSENRDFLLFYYLSDVSILVLNKNINKIDIISISILKKELVNL